MTKKKKNCWEVKKCCREPGGKNAVKFGTCPASISTEYDGINDGDFAGRFCWVVAGTYCNGGIDGSYAKKLKDCFNCDFFIEVSEDMCRHFTSTPEQAKKIKRREKIIKHKSSNNNHPHIETYHRSIKKYYLRFLKYF